MLAAYLSPGASQDPGRLALVPSSEVTLLAGPVRVPAQRMACWKVRLETTDCRPLELTLDRQSFEKELAAGNRYQPVSTTRSPLEWNPVPTDFGT
ncbi:hypothetical protein Pla8534_03980 [Lignipirellula cremea]|uniref:Uncharacterized protein n=1 Tax=Lignipirellula cremea TaxID=2528010 RepID=A0A518DLE0_9BACT|nr:hypothetical protein Pla8534_03980 [Lignipirellula cremea]